MKKLIFLLLIAGCATAPEDDGCFKETLVRIIDYDNQLVYQLETVYVYPTERYDVEEGKEYKWCVDEDRIVVSVH